MPDIAEILEQIERGDPNAASQLLPLVYDELRRLAAAKLHEERSSHTLQPTALVHEAFLRLVDVEKAQHWNSRSHFFAAAAEAMRRILVEHARKRKRIKRGGALARQSLSEVSIDDPSDQEDIVSLNDAMEKLQQVEPTAARLIQLRYFVGLTSKEAAEVLNISPRTADRLWQFARAWLFREISGPLVT